MSDNDVYGHYNPCPFCGGSDEQGCYADCPSQYTHIGLEIIAERRRQLYAEGWSHKHDDEQNAGGEMAKAAACYALGTPYDWPFDRKWWKPKDRRRDLIRAAALIVAEIERLDRAALTTQEKTDG